MNDPNDEPERFRLALFVLAPVTIVLAVVGGTLVALGGPDRAPSTPPPLELASVSGDIAGHYHAARDLAEVYRNVPCYCGCEEFLAHRDLYDCFVRADGNGWEAHAARCGVCIAESALVRELSDADTPAPEIRAAVVARFGTTPATTPPT